MSNFYESVADEELRDRSGKGYAVGQTFLGTVANPLNFVLFNAAGGSKLLVLQEWIVSTAAANSVTMFALGANPGSGGRQHAAEQANRRPRIFRELADGGSCCARDDRRSRHNGPGDWDTVRAHLRRGIFDPEWHGHSRSIPGGCRERVFPSGLV